MHSLAIKKPISYITIHGFTSQLQPDNVDPKNQEFKGLVTQTWTGSLTPCLSFTPAPSSRVIWRSMDRSTLSLSLSLSVPCTQINKKLIKKWKICFTKFYSKITGHAVDTLTYLCNESLLPFLHWQSLIIVFDSLFINYNKSGNKGSWWVHNT